MSSIDKYKNKCIGMIDLKDVESRQLLDFSKVAVYLLDEDVPNEENDLDGKNGDIILGGGSGECPAIRISVPEIYHYFSDDFDGEYTLYDIIKFFYTANEIYLICDIFKHMGWNPKGSIENWILEQVVNYLDCIGYNHKANLVIETNTSIIRRLNNQEIRIMNID